MHICIYIVMIIMILTIIMCAHTYSNMNRLHAEWNGYCRHQWIFFLISLHLFFAENWAAPHYFSLAQSTIFRDGKFGLKTISTHRILFDSQMATWFLICQSNNFGAMCDVRCAICNDGPSSKYLSPNTQARRI